MISQSRTPLYGLPLEGANTGYVESLSSYLQRLAAAHCLNPRTFLHRVFKIRAHRREEEFRFNGIGSAPREVAGLVESFTGVNVRTASMARFEAVLPSTYLVRKVQSAYCPKCVLSRSPLVRAHSRLAWELKCVTACPIHGLKLQIRKCGASIGEWLDPAEKPDLPDVCRDCGSIGLRCHGMSQPATAGELWIAKQAAELLSLSEPEVRSLSFDVLRLGIESAVRHVFDGQPVKAARAAGLARATVHTWIKGNSRPALGALFRFAIHAQAGVVALFRGQFDEVSSAGRAAPQKVRFTRKNWKSILQAVRTESLSDTPASLESFAARIKVNSRQIRRMLPTESSILIERSAASRRQRSQILHDRCVAEFSRAALGLRQEGKTICRKNLEARSGIICFRSISTRYRALMHVLQQFQVPSHADAGRGTY